MKLITKLETEIQKLNSDSFKVIFRPTYWCKRKWTFLINVYMKHRKSITIMGIGRVIIILFFLFYNWHDKIELLVGIWKNWKKIWKKCEQLVAVNNKSVIKVPPNLPLLIWQLCLVANLFIFKLWQLLTTAFLSANC